MIHLLSFALSLAGFTALAFAMRRLQRDVIGRSLRLATTYALRVAGACALLFALGILVAWHGWSLGLVMFSGHSSVTAGIVYCMLVGYAGMHARTLRHR
jgi:high-affinity Fe2+/Pb2+ permease